MWPDNEADVDLLGFDFLVDELMVPLTRPQLLPLTVGLLGEWGSGKSSLLKIVAARLEAEPSTDGGRYVVVPFSPWQFEGYADIKIALMDAVLTRLQAEAASNAPAAEEIGFLRRCLNRLRRPAVIAGRAALVGVGPAAQLAATRFQPDLASLAQAVTQQATAMGNPALDHAEQPLSAAAAAPGADGDVLADVASFRSRFESLVETLEDVTAVIVLVDDLDRCLPGTIVDTFEGIRIFLHTKKSAYVACLRPQARHCAVAQARPLALSIRDPTDTHSPHGAHNPPRPHAFDRSGYSPSPRINRLRNWRGIAFRFDKTPESYEAGLHLCGAMLWLRSSAPHS